jgi:hypothetical protein
LRRPLTFAALALMLFGVEVATGAVSLGAVRLWTGFGAFLDGDEGVVSTARYVSGLAILLSGAILFFGMLWADRVSGRILTEGSVCPNCGTATKRVRRRKRHRILSRILETNVTRRHCERCGWNGLAA